MKLMRLIIDRKLEKLMRINTN